MFATSKIENDRIIRSLRPRRESGSPCFSQLLEVSTVQRLEFLNITDEVRQVVDQSGIETGTVHIQSLHTTLAVFIGEWQDALLRDVESMLKMAVPDGCWWRHNDPAVSDCDRENAVSHLRAMLIGQTANVQVQDGEPLLGTWQRIILVELDGPRTRQVSVQVKGE